MHTTTLRFTERNAELGTYERNLYHAREWDGRKLSRNEQRPAGVSGWSHLGMAGPESDTTGKHPCNSAICVSQYCMKLLRPFCTIRWIACCGGTRSRVLAPDG